MNPNLIRPRNETKDLLLSITANCETLIKQTNTKPRETLEIKLTKPGETFSFKPPISIEGSRMIGLTSLEVDNSILNITEEENKFGLYTDNFDEFSVAEIKVELKEILDVSKSTPEHMQNKIIGLCLISAYNSLETENRRTDGYSMLFMGRGLSPFRDIEN